MGSRRPNHGLACMISLYASNSREGRNPSQETRELGLAVQDQGQAYLELQRVCVIRAGGEVSVHPGTATEGTLVGRLFVITIF